MKRILSILAAAMLVVGVAGNAMAAFEAGNLILVAYEGDHDVLTSGNEAYYDLGATDLSGLPGATGVDTGINLVDFDTSTWSDIKIGLVGGAVSTDGTYQPTTPIFFASDSPGENYVGNTSNFSNGYTALQGDSDWQWDGVAVGNKAVYAKNGYGSYNDSFNGGANPGQYGGTVSATGDFNGEVQLGIGTYETNLYISDGNEVPTLLGTITLDTNSGNLVVSYEAAAVPIPGAVVLLGSGLLALVGIRRKNS